MGKDYQNNDYEVDDELKKYIFPFLYAEGTQTDVKTFIFIDVSMPRVGNSIKTVRVLIEVLSHRNDIKYVKDGYYGTRPDICAQMIEEILVNDKELASKFGIGNLTLTSVGVIDGFTGYYGRNMIFEVPDFR